MSNELQAPNPFVSISLWDTEICYDKMFVSLVGLSKFLEQCAKKSATDFLNIGIHKENGWINSGADYLETEMRRACNQINYYITRNNILNSPNWNMFLEPWIVLADNSKQLTLSLHKSLIDSCRKEVSEQAHQAYLNSMANSEGLGFGIVSNSLTAHLVYAVQSAAKEAENKRKAQAAADSVRLANSPVTKANELFAKAYHETHEPFVLSSLTDFYSSVESFIYKGVGYDKEKIDTQIQKSISILKNSTIDVRQRVLMALSENICCGEVILSVIKSDIADNDFIDFCNHAPIILFENSIDPIIEWLKTEKHTNQLYNRPTFSKKTLHFLSTTQRIFLSDGQKVGFYDEILNGAFSEEISNTYSEFYDLFHIDSVIEKYANNGIHISINNKTINQLAILCNDVRCRKLINYCKAANFSSPIEPEQITTLITHTNATIDKRHSDIVAEQIRIARIEAEAKAEKERIEAEIKAEKERIEAEQRKKRQAELAEQRAKAQAEQEAKHALALKRTKKTISVLTPIIILALIFAFWLWPDVLQPAYTYKLALEKLSSGNDAEAFDLFVEVRPYADSEQYLSNYQFVLTSTERFLPGYGTYSEIYNEKGLLISSTTRSGITYSYEYDDHDRLIVKSGNGQTVEYSYDSAGNLLSVKTNGEFSQYVTAELEEYSYNQDGKLICKRRSSLQDTYFGTTLDVFHIVFYEYDTNGNMIREYYWYNSPDYSSYTSFSRFLTEYSYDENGNCVSEYRYTFDESDIGIWDIEELTYLDNESILNIQAATEYDLHRIYTYEENLLVEEKKYTKRFGLDSPQLDYTTKYFYDNNRLIREEGGTYTRTYIYDDFGNLIKEETDDGATDEYIYTPVFGGKRP